MTDFAQRTLQAFAYSDDATREAAVVCATLLVYALAAAWLLAVWLERRHLSVAVVLRIGMVLVLSFVVAKVLGHVVADPRPYLVEGIKPLTAVSADNGFPSDHALLAAALTATLCWVRPRWALWVAAGTLLVMAGRLGIAAHHTLDVTGGVVIVVVVAFVVALAPLPETWNQPLKLPGKRPG